MSEDSRDNQSGGKLIAQSAELMIAPGIIIGGEWLESDLLIVDDCRQYTSTELRTPRLDEKTPIAENPSRSTSQSV